MDWDVSSQLEHCISPDGFAREGMLVSLPCAPPMVDLKMLPAVSEGLGASDHTAPNPIRRTVTRKWNPQHCGSMGPNPPLHAATGVDDTDRGFPILNPAENWKLDEASRLMSQKYRDLVRDFIWKLKSASSIWENEIVVMGNLSCPSDMALVLQGVPVAAEFPEAEPSQSSFTAPDAPGPGVSRARRTTEVNEPENILLGSRGSNVAKPRGESNIKIGDEESEYEDHQRRFDRY
ncbi:hypothetical protein B0H14DRAFT_2608314 [Mycena olivaceomarginata]|nr:hypothetical protein B0H14DRAFT_2608314 [Mycena olivaceomarginata]